MGRRREVVIVLLCAIGPTVLVGCGDGRTPPDFRTEIRRTAGDFGAAFARRDGARICAELLSRRLRGLLQGGGLGCADAISRAAGAVRDPRLEVIAVGVDSRTTGWATVRSTAAGQAPSTDRLGFVLEDGRWRVASLQDVSPPAPATTPPRTATTTTR